MADIACFEMPVEAGLELGAIIRLDDQHAKGQASDDLGSAERFIYALTLTVTSTERPIGHPSLLNPDAPLAAAYALVWDARWRISRAATDSKCSLGDISPLRSKRTLQRYVRKRRIPVGRGDEGRFAAFPCIADATRSSQRVGGLATSTCELCIYGWLPN